MRAGQFLISLISILTSISAFGQGRPILETGGVLSTEQASYDVTHYDLDLKVMPDEQALEGVLTVTADVVQPLYYLVLDLDTMLQVSAITELGESGNVKRKFQRDVGQIWIDLGRTRQPGEIIRVAVAYGGNPRIAVNPPWDGGLTWARTPSGAHWIATSCQGEGADVWWPCKDHVSDEPRTMDLHITVPEPLVAACNGRLESVDSDTGVRTYNWHISQPINIYTVALNIAPYETIETEYESVSGDKMQFIFYHLPESKKDAEEIFPEFQEHMDFFEDLLGPYPFRADKYGVVETPHLGMEHQSIIAYGAKFNNGSMTGGIDWGFDALHQHELAHEWWGNVITNSSWEDIWLHEGTGTYMQALYAEHIGGRELYFNYMRSLRRFANNRSVAPRQTMTADEIFRAPVYPKGAWVLHSLRSYLGDDLFFKSLRRMIYPNEEAEKATDGSQCRFVTTDDFKNICEETSDKELDWFFEIYLRQPMIPVLHADKVDAELTLRWQLPVGSEFPMPVEIRINDNLESYVVPGDGSTLKITIPDGAQVVVDPYRWILCNVNESW